MLINAYVWLNSLLDVQAYLLCQWVDGKREITVYSVSRAWLGRSIRGYGGERIPQAGRRWNQGSATRKYRFILLAQFVLICLALLCMIDTMPLRIFIGRLDILPASFSQCSSSASNRVIG